MYRSLMSCSGLITDPWQPQRTAASPVVAAVRPELDVHRRACRQWALGINADHIFSGEAISGLLVEQVHNRFTRVLVRGAGPLERLSAPECASLINVINPANERENALSPGSLRPLVLRTAQ